MTARSRSCAELGVCQGRPGCACVRHPFAPGAIEHHKARSGWLRRLGRAVDRHAVPIVVAAFLLGCYLVSTTVYWTCK